MARFILLFVALLWGLPAMAQSGLPDGTQGLACLATANPVVANSEGYWGRAVCDLKGQLYVNGTASGGSTGPAQTASNATDGQATSTTNQQNVVYNYIWNGSSWDRVRGTGGAVNTASSQLPASLGAKSSANSFSVAPATDATFAVTGAFFQATQPVSEANGANVVLGSQGDAANANTVMGQLKQQNINLLLATPAAVTAAAPTYTTGTTQPLSLNTGGGLRVDPSGVTAPTNLTQQAGTVLGAPTAYGTAPTGNVSGVNANVTASTLPTGASTSANQTTELASLATIAQRQIPFSDQTGTSYAANGAVISSTIRDSGAASPYTRFNGAVTTTQAGTFVLLGCVDSACGSNFILAQQSVAAGGVATLTAIIVPRYYRTQFVPGATAGAVTIASSFTAN